MGRRYYDIIIIGGGVVGSSIARELSRYQVNTAVLEKEADVCCGNSGRNTGLLHAGFFYQPGTQKARFTVEGNRAFDKIANELDIPFKRTGKLVVGFTDEDRIRLHELMLNGNRCGVPGLEIIGRDEIKALAQYVDAEYAMYSPTSGITCPYLYTIALAENAKSNGVDYYFEHEVISVKLEDNGIYTVHTPLGSFRSKWIINSCGIESAKMSALLGSFDHKIAMVKGEYILLDKNAGEYLNMPIYPAPDENWIFDIHVTPTVDGNVLIGPTCDEFISTADFDTSGSAGASLIRGGSMLFKNMRPDLFIRRFSGIFPRLIDPVTGNEASDFTIEHRKESPHIINLVGINSPGLTCAYPIGKYVADLIADNERLNLNKSFNPERKGIQRFSEQDYETQQELIRLNPDYGEIICRCEHVTRAEIIQAIKNPLGVTSVNAIKYRTRATMGRCQGGYCETRITSILENELGIDKTDICLNDSKSYMFTGKVI